MVQPLLPKLLPHHELNHDGGLVQLDSTAGRFDDFVAKRHATEMDNCSCNTSSSFAFVSTTFALLLPFRQWWQLHLASFARVLWSMNTQRGLTHFLNCEREWYGIA